MAAAEVPPGAVKHAWRATSQGIASFYCPCTEMCAGRTRMAAAQVPAGAPMSVRCVLLPGETLALGAPR